MKTLLLVTNFRKNGMAVGRDRMIGDLKADLDRLAGEGRFQVVSHSLDIAPRALAGLRWLTSGLTLPEAYYSAPGAPAGAADIVVVSGWPAMGAICGLRHQYRDAIFVCDVDDDYAARLAAWRSAGVGYAPGQLGADLPGWLHWLLSGPAGVALNHIDGLKGRRRARKLRRTCDAMVFTSPTEAAAESARSPARGQILALPPRFHIRRPAITDDRPGRLIFLGTDRLAQNAESLRSITASWQRNQLSEPVHVYGDVDSAKWAPLTVHGYARDIEQAFSPESVLLYPCLISGGIKIKLLEAIEWGVPFLTTQQGIGGLPIEPGSAFLIASPEEAIGVLHDRSRLQALREATRDLQARLGTDFAAHRQRFWDWLNQAAPAP